MKTSRPPSTPALVAGFSAIYVIWGSTYLAIRFGVETMPPFLMAAARFLLAGAGMYGWMRARGAPRPTGRQWGMAALTGCLLLLGGNGLVTWAEQWVPSGLAALIVASVPLWMALMNWILSPEERPGPLGLTGIILGFAGVAYLVNPGGEVGADRQVLIGAGSIVVASALWAAGSLISRRADLPPSPFLTTAMQMLTGGAALGLVGTLAGEWGRFDPAAVSVRSAIALAYLVTFGSVVALSAYVWLLTVTTPAKVSTYAYVNPVVAVGLGWWLANEAVTAQTLAAAAVIVAAVFMITREKTRVRAATPAAEPEPAAGTQPPGKPEPAAGKACLSSD